MEKKQLKRRLFVLGSLFAVVLAAYVTAMFDAQVVHGKEYLARSVRANTKTESVETSRGSITDRNGKLLVSNRNVYTLALCPSLAAEDNETCNNDMIRLIELLKKYNVSWTDELPVSASLPYTFDFSVSNRKSELYSFLKSKKIYTYVPSVQDDPPFTVAYLLSLLREYYQLDSSISAYDARKIIGLRYTLDVTKAAQLESRTIASGISVALISELKDGCYRAVTDGISSMREYHTDAAAHVLGRVNRIYAEDWPSYKEKGYAMDSIVGIDGVELAFEDYLRGKDGKRVVTTNSAGKVTNEIYSVEPEPGNTVALTLDIDLQEDVERILAEKVNSLTEEDGIPRGAGAVVIQVGTGEVLALASYPNFSLKTYNEDYADNYNDPMQPFFNRATQGTYAPGSTFKPLTAIAALETGIITPQTIINATGVYHYYDLNLKCWLYGKNGGSHGPINVTQAITVSCNYFFYDVGRKTGISTLSRYAAAFGLGEPTGIEIPESIGVMTSPDYVNSLRGHYWTDGQTLTAAIGQSYSNFTPLQLANYIATLCANGRRSPAHLLKNVKAYDNSSILSVYDKPDTEIISIAPENLKAVLSGMHQLVVSGSVSSYFKDCVVDAGAKTGTAQTGGEDNNGVFVCFAPYDKPEIAVAIVIEKAGSGGALASSAVSVLNSYFSSADAQRNLQLENTLLQ